MYTQEFVNLVMGDRGMYPIPYDMNGSNKGKAEAGAKFLLDYGYTISNLPDLKALQQDQIDEFIVNFKPDTKAGYILRKSFADSKEFKEYSDEEWQVIFAQYALTYGWAGEYQEIFGNAATNVISNYNNEEVKELEQIMEGSKVIKIGFRADTVNLIKEILESKVVLRTHQKKTLKACPADVLAEAYRKSNITIRETMIQTIVLLKDSGCLQYGEVFRTPTDVLRFILAMFAHEPFEGQITKPDLADRKVKIPTSYRKWLLKELDNMGGAQHICEDMFKYESYWKLMHRYLMFGKSATSHKRYPTYHLAIDLLFDGDRSWTFNGRYSAAIAAGNYSSALDVALERPGFLFRNMLNFLRYPKGTKIAQIASNKTVSLDPMDKGNNNVVQSDNIAFFASTAFAYLVSNKANTKLAFQLLEQLKSPTIYADQHERNVQGIIKRYTTPIPGIKEGIALKVIAAIRSGIRLKLRKRNENVGMVFIDPALKDNSLQYSGRSSTETNYSGTFLTPGSMIDIPDTNILRLGVLWKGSRSTDIDHNVSAFTELKKVVDVYFGHPTYKDLINSSGDITHCTTNSFSAEFIDINLEKVRKSPITSLITSLISFSGNPISDTECYLFIKGIDREERIIHNRSFTMDLMDTDYAIRIDPDSIENSNAYIGFNVVLDTNKIQVCAITPKDSSIYSTIRSKRFTPQSLDGVFGNQTSLYETLEMAFSPEQVTTDLKLADVIFGEGGLNPNTQLEEINKYIL